MRRTFSLAVQRFLEVGALFWAITRIGRFHNCFGLTGKFCSQLDNPQVGMVFFKIQNVADVGTCERA